MIPTLYSGRSGRKSQASENIRNGPITQFRKRETLNIFPAPLTLESSSYLTLARGGYIIHNNPIAIGSDTVSIRNLSKIVDISGKM